MMIAEGIIVMFWAATAMSLFDGYSGLHELLTAGGPGVIVSQASTMMLGAIGGTLAVLSVVILPITSRDIAIIAEYLSIAQRKFSTRLLMAVPLFSISLLLTKIDFNIL
jgi:hypothetical protein